MNNLSDNLCVMAKDDKDHKLWYYNYVHLVVLVVLLVFYIVSGYLMVHMGVRQVIQPHVIFHANQKDLVFMFWHVGMYQ